MLQYAPRHYATVLMASLLWATPFASIGLGLPTAATCLAQQQGSGAPATTSPAASKAASAAPERFERGVALFQDAQRQAELGRADSQRTLLKEAITQFQAALEQEPKLVEAQSNIGFAWLTLGQYRKASKAFRAALDIAPKHLNTLNGLATVLALSKKLPESLAVYDKLITLDPGNAQYQFNRGSVLQRAKRWDEAQKAYEAALKIDPNDQRSLFNLATLMENKGALQQARTYYQRAKDVAIESPIGLEAVRRLEALPSPAASSASETTSVTPAPRP
jgi:tetratricopeptide (TPR) repeat protein